MSLLSWLRPPEPPPIPPSPPVRADVLAARAETLARMGRSRIDETPQIRRRAEELAAELLPSPTAPSPEELWMEVRVSEEGQRAREFQRMYGRASATIGAQRGTIALLRAERDDAEARADAWQDRYYDVAPGDMPEPGQPVDQQQGADEPTFPTPEVAAGMARHPAGTGLVEREDMPPGWVRVCPRCDLDVEALPGRTICAECEDEVGTRPAVRDFWASCTNGLTVPPVLVDRDGEEWHWVTGAYHSTSSPCQRDEIEIVWGPVTEKAVTP